MGWAGPQFVVGDVRDRSELAGWAGGLVVEFGGERVAGAGDHLGHGVLEGGVLQHLLQAADQRRPLAMDGGFLLLGGEGFGVGFVGWLEWLEQIGVPFYRLLGERLAIRPTTQCSFQAARSRASVSLSSLRRSA